MALKVTVAVPVHNEEKNLPYSLKSVYDLGVDEIIWGLDRCTDKTEAIIKTASRSYPATSTRVIKFTGEDGQGWRERLAFLFRSLYSEARNDQILNSAGDLILDPVISKYLRAFPRMRERLISFGYMDWPFTYQMFMSSLLARTGLTHGMSGIITFSRDVMYETEDRADLRLNSVAEDTHLQMAVSSKYPTRHILTRTLHLRHSESPQEHYKRGQAQWIVQRKNLIWSVAHSVIMIRPRCLSGYLEARRMDRV